jgi:hypothetical protein
MTTAERIAAIDAILQAGAEQARHGDRWITYDLAELRRERERLTASQRGGGFRRVVMNNRG